LISFVLIILRKLSWIGQMNTNCAIFVIADKISHCGMLGILIIRRKLTNDVMIGLDEK
jgi:hypothetical protein